MSENSNIPDLTEENIKQLEDEYSQIMNANFKQAADVLLDELKKMLESAKSTFEVSQAQAEVMSKLFQLQNSAEWKDDAERLNDWPKAMGLFTNLSTFRQQQFKEG